MVVVVIAVLVLISAGSFQRPGPSQLVISPNGQVFPIQVGGTISNVKAWESSNGPVSPKTAIPSKPGPYSVVGKPSLSVDFMNKVLAYYHSPAAGKAQALYDDGIKYGLDPAYALAFFMHESSFGTAGVARVTLSLSNMRCVPEYRCLQENGGYAIFDTCNRASRPGLSLSAIFMLPTGAASLLTRSFLSTRPTATAITRRDISLT